MEQFRTLQDSLALRRLFVEVLGFSTVHVPSNAAIPRTWASSEPTQNSLTTNGHNLHPSLGEQQAAYEHVPRTTLVGSMLIVFEHVLP